MLAKDIIRHIQQRLRYPTAHVFFGGRLVDCTVDGPLWVHSGAGLLGCIVEGPVTVRCNAGLSNCQIGRYSYVGANSTIANTVIGRFTSIASQVMMGGGIHPSRYVTTSPAMYSSAAQCGVSLVEATNFEEIGDIHIGNDVWIGFRAYIRDNVRIGDGCIIGAGAVVARDTPDYSVVGGVPARVIRMRFPVDAVARLSAIQWWDWPEPKLRVASSLLAQEDVYQFLDWAENSGRPHE